MKAPFRTLIVVLGLIGTAEVLPLHSSVDQAEDGDNMLVFLTEKAHYGMSMRLSSAIDWREDVYISYDVRSQKRLDCGGAYIKLISEKGFTGRDLSNDTEFSVMFGPDKCGSDDSLKLIINIKTTKGVISHHLTDAPHLEIDGLTHQYGLHWRADGRMDLYMDGVVVKQVDINTAEDFEPPFVSPQFNPIPGQKKPLDWVEEKLIPDPSAKKPDDWNEDEPKWMEDANAKMPEGWREDLDLEIVDEDDVKPESWDDDADGKWTPSMIENPLCRSRKCGPWQPPIIDNPDYRGKWKAPMVRNPLYKGEWAPRMQANPAYRQYEGPLMEPSTALAIEVMNVNPGMSFDNFFISQSSSDHGFEQWILDTYFKKHDAETKNRRIRRALESSESSWTEFVWAASHVLSQELFLGVSAAYLSLGIFYTIVIILVLTFLFFGAVYYAVSLYCSLQPQMIDDKGEVFHEPSLSSEEMWDSIDANADKGEGLEPPEEDSEGEGNEERGLRKRK